MRRIKAALDPAGYPQPGQDPLADPMGKVIFWIVVVFAVLFALRLYNAAQAKKRARRQCGAPASRGPMVRCAKCGVFLPRAEAMTVPTRFRCHDPNCALPP